MELNHFLKSQKSRRGFRFRRLLGVGIVIAAVVLVASCTDGLIGPDGDDSGVTDLPISIAVPDFEEHIFPDSTGRATTSVIDPASQCLVIELDGPDMDPIVVGPIDLGTINNWQSVDDTDYTYNGWYRHEDGWGGIDFVVKNVPLGTNRIVRVATYLSQDDYFNELPPLTHGEREISVHLNMNWDQWIGLIPYNATPLVFGDVIPLATVLPGRLKYYKIVMPTYHTHALVSLHSDTDDVDLFAYNWEGDLWDRWRSYQFEEPPIDEAVILENNNWWDSDYPERRTYYVAVYGQNDLDGDFACTFDLEVRELEGEPFDDQFVVRQVDPVDLPAYESLTVTADFDGEFWGTSGRVGPVYGEINLPFDFVFNGNVYNTVYVSPTGYVSFWKYRHYYDWGWLDQSSWSGWRYWNWWFDWEYLPNELIALYQTNLWFKNDSTSGDPISRILYRTDTITDANGDPKGRLIVEYYEMYREENGTDPTYDKLISGQIVLIEGDVLFGEPQNGTIQLRYSRDTATGDSYMANEWGFIGIENETGNERLEPYDWPDNEDLDGDTNPDGNGIPDVDFEFTMSTGGASVTLE